MTGYILTLICKPGQQKTFKVLLTASYAGTYYLPAVSCEAMYDPAVCT